MIIDQAKQKCSHKPCACTVEPGRAYCGAYCEAAASMPAPVAKESCGCRHPSCADAAQTRRQEETAQAV
jgi:hypothetical protein